ncbi:rab3 GTPase-activating protein catalytic subunit-like [Rhopilema esculentum]|uniref:rab3 GTPase-activating protein catalytic subunit-like n=1 Tax=Rhopilema esculentum TaxID=499914 RepID=UPI0031E08153|eukprot:gene13680-4584_t
MADDSDSEPEVFEITDFTTASDWERFIAKLEDIICSWDLDKSHKEDTVSKKKSRHSTGTHEKEQGLGLVSSSKKGTQEGSQVSHEGDWNICTNHLPFANFNFTITYHSLVSQEGKNKEANNSSKKVKEANEDSHDHPPTSMMDMFDFEFDFPPRAHCLARWNGVKAFLVLSPSNPHEEINTESRSKLLLSSVAVALSNTNCDTPVFVQVQQRWRRLYFGICMGNGFRVSYEMAHMKKTPQQCQNLTGLLDVFKSKLAVPSSLLTPVTISVRFTYILGWNEEEWVQDPPDFESGFGAEVGYLILSRLPFGPLQDPISELHLATSWPWLTEETFVDDSDFSDLNPVEAPRWSIRARSAENCTSLLHDHLQSFLKICKSSESTQQIIRSLSKDELELDSYGDITQALDKLAEPKKRLSQTKLSSSTRVAKREQMKLRESPLPEDLLNKILMHLFPDSHEDMEHAEERQRLLAEEQKQIEEDEKKDRFRTMKSAPEKSLVSLLTICLCMVNHSYGGVNAFAHLWHEFVLEMRYRYENNIQIPRIALGSPNLNYCLIHQKLQMLNYCIERKKELYERSSKPTSTTSLTSLKTQSKTDPVVESTEPETTLQKTSWKVESNESDSDDEFFEAVEEQASKNSNEEEQSQSQNESPSGSFISLTKSASDVSFERIGVSKETEMKLLETDEPLCIPITQEPPPVTEDIIEEQTEIILKLGRSEGGSKYLAQMQSGSLFSDVQAFKAANPGCIFEDFVRWYSPNDWIAGPETQQEKEDLAKMKASVLKKNERAELEEVVGTEAIDGWDLDADEKITDEDIMEVDVDASEAEKPKWANEGHLSVRMQIPGNIWLDTWHSAKPVPVRRQKRLFDDTKEAEKVLHFLANLKPAEIAMYLFPVSVHTAIGRILLENESSRHRISNIVTQVIHDTARLGLPKKDNISKMMGISRQLQIAELAISRIQFLEKKFKTLSGKKDDEALDDEIQEFVSQLLSAPDVIINGGPRGKIGKLIAKHIENNQQKFEEEPSHDQETSLSDGKKAHHRPRKLSFPAPAGREYILRTTVRKPRDSSRPSPQRMFAVITPDEFRLAGAFTRDTAFI